MNRSLQVIVVAASLGQAWLGHAASDASNLKAAKPDVAETDAGASATADSDGGASAGLSAGISAGSASAGLSAAPSASMAKTAQPDADAPAPAQDELKLKDGRVIKGQIVAESSSKITVVSKGSKHVFDRSSVAGINYGSGPEDAAPAPAPRHKAEARAASGDDADDDDAQEMEPVPRARPTGRLITDLAVRYSVPESEVVWVRRQGMTDKELPLVFLVAATAQVLPGVVVRLRLRGLTWNQIYAHFGMEPAGIYYVPGPWYAYPYYRPGYYWGWRGGWGHGGAWGGGWGRGYGHHWR